MVEKPNSSNNKDAPIKNNTKDLESENSHTQNEFEVKIDQKTTVNPEKEVKEKENNKKSNPNDVKFFKARKSTIQIPLYITLWVVYTFLTNILPVVLLWYYGQYVLQELFMNSPLTGQPRVFNTIFYEFYHPVELFEDFLPILLDPKKAALFFTIPLVLIGLYLLRYVCIMFVGKFYYWLFNQIRPRKELKNAQPIGEEAKDIRMYHLRGFFLRMLKWEFTKGPFPWLTTVMYNFIGSNKLGKNVVFEEGIICPEFLEMGDNCYIGTASCFTSHLVEGQYGALTVQKIKIDKNSTTGALCFVGPGSVMGEHSQLIPPSGIGKYGNVKANTSFFGLPAARVSNKKYLKYIKLPEEQYPEKKRPQSKDPTENQIL